MGQSNSNQNDRANMLASYDEMDTKCDYGTIIVHKVTKQTYLLKQLNIPDQEEFKRNLKLFQAKKQKIRQNVLNLVQLQNQSKSLFCSQIYRISLVYEFTQITLAQQIQARQPELRYFEQQDLWSIIQSCLYGLVQIDQNIILQPNRVYIMSDGLVKIIDPDIVSGNSWFMVDENIYYSPERFENFSNLNKINTTQGEAMFSLGATLLNAAILQSCFDCYEYSDHRFNYNKLLEKVSKLEELYSQDFKTVICGLLEIDPSKRMSMGQIQDIVTKLVNQETQQQQEPQQSRQEYREEPSYREEEVKSEQPFKDVGNYQYQKQPHMSNPPPAIKFKNIEITNNLQPITENYKSYSIVQQSRFTQHEHHIVDSRFESVKSKNVYERSVRFQTSTVKDYTSLYKTQRDRDEDLFTDPKLMEQIRRDISQITARRSLLPTTTTTNYNSGLVSHQEKLTPSMHHRQPEPIRHEPTRSETIRQEPTRFQPTKHEPSRPQVHYQEDGKVYEGKMFNGMKQGYGRLSYPEGPFYLGDFHKDKMHGKGALYYDEDKPAYDGEWFQDQFHGQGILFNENPLEQSQPFDFSDFNMVQDFWTRYEGQFICDNKQGFGRLYLSNGQRFEGQFQRDYINGDGTFFDKFGDKYEGKWDNNILEERFSRR